MLQFIQTTTRLLRLSVALSAGASAADYYVSPAGQDASDGAEATPWRTLSHAVAQAVAGDTVSVKSGVYEERVVFPHSGSEDASIVFRAADGEAPIVDGTGLSVEGRQGLFELQDRSFIRIEGFSLRNFASSGRNQVPVGILIEGSGHGIELVGNTVGGIASTARVREDLSGRNAHGIAVYGNQEAPVADLLILENHLRNLTLGSSEAMVLNGNVDGFQILKNVVVDCDNIGIDAIGFEGTAPSERLDQARNGLIAGNTVERITTVSNPSYGGGTTSAGGIYVDGGRDIIIERNLVANCDIGIEVASEHLGKVTSGITVRSNLLRDNRMGGLFIGGYNESSTGSAADCRIAHNTFYNNGLGTPGNEFGQIHLQYRVIDTEFIGNILYANLRKDDRYNLMVLQWNQSGSGHVFDRNLYYGPDTPVWVIDDQWIEGFANYRQLALSGPHETFADPLFRDPQALDFSLRANSPAINLGAADER